MQIDRILIKCDGGARGNPGPAAIGAVLYDTQNRVITTISRIIGTTTNNQAEYRAVIAALEEAVRLGACQVELRIDSELIVRQLNGQYRVKKAELKPLHQRVKELQSRLDRFTVTHIPREHNREADRLVNMALDAAEKPDVNK
jgi:ribonuclease HI